jgi:mannosyltransferase OCH1-like enzyme
MPTVDTDQQTAPPVIHQMWGNLCPPEPFASYLASVKAMNSYATHILWTDDAMNAFMAGNFPTYSSWYNGLPLPVHRWDVFRYFVLYSMGGMYLDIDMEPTSDFQQLFTAPLTLCSEHPDDSNRLGKPTLVSNAMMIAASRSEFIGLLIRRLSAKTIHPCAGHVVKDTGPLFLTDVWEGLGRPGQLLDHCAFYPNSLRDKAKTSVGTYATHKFASTWWGQRQLDPGAAWNRRPSPIRTSVPIR